MHKAGRLVVASALVIALAAPSGAFASTQPLTGASESAEWSASYSPKPLKDDSAGIRALSQSLKLAPAAADDNVPGVALPASPVANSLNMDTDMDDVFRVSLSAGDRIDLSLTAGSATDYDLYVFDESATDVAIDAPLYWAWGLSYPETVSFVAPYTGDFYIDVYAAEGVGSYSLSYSVGKASKEPTPENVGLTEDFITSEDANGWGNVNYSVNLVPGERFTASLGDQTGPFHLCFFDPDTTDNTLFHEDPYAVTHGSAPGVWLTNTVDFVCPPDGGGTYVLEVSGWGTIDWGEPYSFTWTRTGAPTGLHRLNGTSRYATSQVISRSSFNHADTVVLATGANFADALAASALAGAVGGPLLLTNSQELSEETLIELARLNATDVIIVGGTAAVSTAVQTDLVGLGYTVERIAGGGRYETARKIADEVAEINGGVSDVFVVRGDAFADALAASPYAYSQGIPVLLTPTGSLDAHTSDFITDNGVTNVWIAGGTSAVSNTVQSQLEALNGGATNVVLRFAGAGRYDTAQQVAERAIIEGWATEGYVGVATGTNFPDALGGAAACGVRGGALLLTDPSTLSADVKEFLMGHPADSVAIFGGFGAVKPAVQTELLNYIP